MSLGRSPFVNDYAEARATQVRGHSIQGISISVEMVLLGNMANEWVGALTKMWSGPEQGLAYTLANPHGFGSVGVCVVPLRRVPSRRLGTTWWE